MFEKLINNLEYMSKSSFINWVVILATFSLFFEGMYFLEKRIKKIFDIPYYKNYEKFYNKLPDILKLVILLLNILIFNILPILLHLLLILLAIYSTYFIFFNFIPMDQWLSGFPEKLICCIGIMEIILLIILIKFQTIKKGKKITQD